MYIWQKRIGEEVDLIFPEIKERNRNLNILFRAPSGYGKTTAGFICLNYLGMDNCYYYIPDSDGNIPIIGTERRFHFIDEIHLVKNPEFLYPLMDSGKYTFILASNESGTLKEPLRNRCIQLIFSKYTREELNLIVKNCLDKYNLSDEMIEIIASRVKGNPRIAKIICIRLDIIFSRMGVSESIDELIFILDKILYVKENGITELDEIYLNYLQKCGGLAGINTLINGTHIDKETILNEIEPNLIELGQIIITSRGRKHVI